MNRRTEANQLLGRESSICYLLFHYIWIVIIIAISLISVLDLFYGDVEFLLSFNVELCKICNNTLSYVFFLVQFKNIRIESLGKAEMLTVFLYQVFALKCGSEKLLLPPSSGQVPLMFQVSAWKSIHREVIFYQPRLRQGPSVSPNSITLY